MSIVNAVGQFLAGGAEAPPVLYGGGSFTAAGAEMRNRAAVVSSDPSLSLSEIEVGAWNPDCDNIVFTMILSGSDMYLGGAFTTVRGSTRNRAACVDSDSAQAAPALRAWNPDCDNLVYILLLNGADMYLGGNFTVVRGNTRNRAACVDSDPSQAAPTLRAWNPDCNNLVRSMILNVSDMYLGGDFTVVRGNTRNRAACVDSDPSQASPALRAWNPDCSGGVVSTMLLNGSDMYLGGTFTTVRGTTRNRAACVDSDPSQANPTLRNWNPDCSISVRTMLLNGPDMYLGGGFTTVRGTTRNSAACVDSDPSQASPALRAWNPDCSGGSVDVMLLNGPDMYLGGSFPSVQGILRRRAACVDSDPAQATPTVRAWDPDCSNATTTLILVGADMYLGGQFTTLGGASEHAGAFASPLDPEASALDLFPWNPDCSSTVESMILSGSNMYLGGDFTTVRGTTRNHVACVDSNPAQASPDLRAWNPDCNNLVRSMILNGSDMYLGGTFTAVRVSTRNRAACVDSNPSQASPALRAWNPDCGSTVITMLLNGSDMYLGGVFTTVRGSTRNRAACVDSDPSQASPALRAWNPDCGGVVWSMLLNGSDMYLGGNFTVVRGNTRNRAACVDSNPAQASPDLRAWNPDCGSTVRSMLLNGSDMYLGGVFTTVRGSTRNRAACVDSDPSQASPALRAWNPDCGGVVITMVLNESDMYMGGVFTTVGVSDRLRIAAVDSDPDMNILLNFDLELNNTVLTLVLG